MNTLVYLCPTASCVGMLEDFDTSNPSKAAIMVLIMECVMHLSIVCI